MLCIFIYIPPLSLLFHLSISFSSSPAALLSSSRFCCRLVVVDVFSDHPHRLSIMLIASIISHSNMTIVDASAASSPLCQLLSHYTEMEFSQTSAQYMLYIIHVYTYMYTYISIYCVIYVCYKYVDSLLNNRHTHRFHPKCNPQQQ